MERELLLEIGTEEIPASWLPGLTAQLGTVLEAKLKDARLSTDEPIETFSTPRRLTVRSVKISERQTDLEELRPGRRCRRHSDPMARSRLPGRASSRSDATEDQIERVKTPKVNTSPCAGISAADHGRCVARGVDERTRGCRLKADALGCDARRRYG
jgi:glycyl-tRNA synthetase beta subunit